MGNAGRVIVVGDVANGDVAIVVSIAGCYVAPVGSASCAPAC